MRLSGLVVAFCCGSVIAGAAERSAIPNFSPDSSTGWIAGDPNGANPVGQDFIPPEIGPGPVANDPAYPHVDDGAARRAGGTQPTVRVADLNNPILLPWVKDALKKVNEHALSGKPHFTPKERCWPIGVPGWVLYPVRPVWFLQTPKEVVMIWEEDHMVRHVYLTDRHSANLKPSWFGESIGHYESGKALDVSVHVEDPGAFTTPWNARQKYRRASDGSLVESSCQENNSDFLHYDVEPIPMATKPDF